MCFPKVPMADSVDSMISYPNYKYYFPIKALGLYAKKYGNPEMGEL